MASDCSSAAGEVSQAPPVTTSHAKAKLKRRRVKREGPPQLQFLIATDLSQFRDKDAKRSIRSQAMIHWRHEEDKKKRRDSAKDDLASGPAHAWNNPTLSGLSQANQSISRPAEPTPGHLQHASWQTAPQPLALSSSSTVTCTSSWELTATEKFFPYYHEKSQATTLHVVTSYEESEKHEERQLRVLIAGLAASFGHSYDVFDVMPQFKDSKLNALYLSRICMRAFSSDSTMRKWLPLMLSHSHIILSSTILASTWLDMQQHISGDSTRTTRVKAETIGMLNKRLLDPASQLEDATLVVILHLFAGEMWICNEKALRIHENGVATFISRRGGISMFDYNIALAEVAIACCYHCDIICEAEILPAFRDGLPRGPVLSDEVALPESPLYCPRCTFLTIQNDPQCSPSTLELLTDMRDITDIYVAHKTALNTVHDMDAIDITQLSPPNEAYEATIHAIQTRLSTLPSAHTPGVSVSGDWVYETCRIAALIYTTAIAMGVSLSVAADPKCVDLFATPLFPTSGDDNEQADKPHLSQTLFETLQRTDTGNLWKNMSGVLYWVSAVGAAAARTPDTVDMSQRERLMPEANSVWVRRYLIMTATRTMIVLVFEHPTAIIAAQHKFLKVQELIGSHASRRLET
ncbi:hypothetical protein SVAN01_03849 [Stagonosporopsis vannaccii]|nr:hypothetical protein SVAN01_03849 [Stagonosporopsis vannaccii]